uniref:Immunoglobulin subtype domain-containing protein n=1 Tax=Nothobranchius furzeri TaxID=105023 RepID=A0A8C6PJI2_NOTFU
MVLSELECINSGFVPAVSTGSSAGTPVFVPTGGDLNLDVSDADFPKTFDLFFWKFKTENVMVTYQPNGEPNIREEYRRRIEVSEKKYSVRLKHLTKGDSGTYVARVTAGKDRILAEYDVTVQDPVSPVDLISDSVSKNSTCNVTAACTTPESSISSSFRCDAKTCYQEGGRSEVNTSGGSLRIYLLAESIICNHSNQVSWLKNETNLRSFCTKIAANRGHQTVRSAQWGWLWGKWRTRQVGQLYLSPEDVVILLGSRGGLRSGV